MGFTNLILFQSAYSCSAHCPFFISFFLSPLTPLSSFFLPLQLLCCPQPPSPLSLWLSAEPGHFFLPPSLCITLFQPNGITGEHVSLSGFALYYIFTYRCEVNEMEYKNDPFLPLLPPLPSSLPLFLNIFLLVSLLFLVPDFESLFLSAGFDCSF